MTTQLEIAAWFDDGKRQKKTHMIVVCDTFDYEDFPVYADGDDDCTKRYRDAQSDSMQRVMEVYDLRMDREMQLNEHRAMHLPQSK